ncbi:MAG: hypothetical protein M3Z57_02545 [Candidatus Dormibacteraeota bacterium]|nr:hypothetical protein [Candidatus Dormibacteraeota bacterium]
MTAAAASSLIDRAPQNLHIPLGGMAPVRVNPPHRARIPRLDMSRLLLGVGVVASAVGLWLLVAPAPVSVSLVGDRLEVGGMILTAVAPTAQSQPLRYEGDASYVLAEHTDGSAVAAAAWISGGVRSTGVCRLRRQGVRLIDECTFAVGGGHLTSVDVLDPARGPVWQRTYGDGGRATIGVLPEGGAVPVPFPIGR